MPQNEISISLDKGTKHHFTPGEVLAGQVTLHLPEPKTYKELVITFKGRVKTRWIAGNHQYHHTVRQKEVLFNMTSPLSSPDDGQLGTFIGGEHHFRFAFTLPTGIPSTYIDNENGNISYKVVTCLRAPPFHIDVKKSCHFLVKGILDLNVTPWLREPHEIHKVVEVVGWCCSREGGDIEYKLRLKRTAIVWEEVIPLSIEIRNQSTKDIVKWSVKLVQNVVFKAEGEIKTVSHLLHKKKGYVIKKEGQIEESDFKEFVLGGDLFPSNFGGSSKLIMLTYQLLLKIVPGSGSKIRERIPILVGDIPFT